MILGHLTGTYLIVKLFKPKATIPLLTSSLIGAYFPDIIDKSLMLFSIGNGRFVAHSLPFLSILLGIISLPFLNIKSLREYRHLYLWFSLGCYLHLLQDFVQIKTLLWPFLGSFEAVASVSRPSLTGITKEYYSFKGSQLIWTELGIHFLFIIYQTWLFFLTRRKKEKTTHP
ncbi:MAG: metal-dependent hydrolase [Bdellovibrionota bacterium]|nr:metal-dependent hydrolase [Bdellovibrionota bacterium]